MRGVGKRSVVGRRAVVVAIVAAFVGVLAGPASASNAPDPTRPDIELSVNASIDRPFTWTIDKTADKQDVTLQPGETTTVNYTVTVTPTEGTTSWSAVGEIIVYNKDLEPVTVNSVTNVISGVGPSTLTCPGSTFPRQLNSGAQLRCRFTSEVPDNSNRTSTATASVGTSEFTVTQPIDFGTAIDNRIDHCVSVHDSVAGLLAEQICVNKVDKTVAYSRQIGPYAECGSYSVPNTAWAITNETGTRVEDSFTVDVDVPCTQPCSLGDFVWMDKNKDGVQNDGVTSGVNGVKLALLDRSYRVVARTTTANNPATGAAGWYRFEVECGKEYRVHAEWSNFFWGGPLAGTFTTWFDVGSESTDSDVYPLLLFTPKVIVASGSDTSVDLGFVKLQYHDWCRWYDRHEQHDKWQKDHS
jgi:SdrD B-like domain